jgi:hypothetical protein
LADRERGNNQIRRRKKANNDHVGTVSYRLDIQYRYEVANQSHVGSRVNYTGESYDLKADAELVARRYPVNSKVDVYYNPGNVTESVLEPGTSASNYWFLLIVPPIMFLMGIFCCYCAWRGTQQYRAGERGLRKKKKVREDGDKTETEQESRPRKKPRRGEL